MQSIGRETIRLATFTLLSKVSAARALNDADDRGGG